MDLAVSFINCSHLSYPAYKSTHSVDTQNSLKNLYARRIHSPKKFHSNPLKATGFTAVFRYNFVRSVGKGALDGRSTNLSGPEYSH